MNSSRPARKDALGAARGRVTARGTGASSASAADTVTFTPAGAVPAADPAAGAESPPTNRAPLVSVATGGGAVVAALTEALESVVALESENARLRSEMMSLRAENQGLKKSVQR